MILIEFFRPLVPVILHFSFVLYITYIKSLNRLEFLGLNFSAVFTSLFLYQFIEFLYSTWIGVWLGHGINLRKTGKWAIVTGASDGIGLSYCKELAAQKINLVMMSRSLDRLEKLANQLESEFSIKTKVIDADFSRPEIYDNIRTSLEGMEIGILINNVGMSYQSPEYFHCLPSPKFLQDMINTNIMSVTMMTEIVLPGMIERKRGVVVNIGSITCASPVPWFSLYSGTKAFMEKFTENLADEYRDRGITFQYLLPGYVATNLSKIKESTVWVPGPARFVKMAVNSIGLQEKSALWIPHRMLLFVYFWSSLFFPKTCRNVMTKIIRSFWLYARKREMQKSISKSM